MMAGEGQWSVYPVRVRSSGIINYCYVLVDRETSSAALVDPAWEPERIVAVVENVGATPTAVFLTHSHLDHVDLAPAFARRYQVPVFMSEAEIDYFGFRCLGLESVRDGDALRVGSNEVRVLLTPGHTAGSTCYVAPGVLFTGDTVFIEGCGLIDDRESAAMEMFLSLRRIAQTVDPESLVFPGHRYGAAPGVPLTTVLENNIYFHFQDPVEFRRFRLRGNQRDLFAFM